MPFPRIEQPTFEFQVPSTGKTVEMTPFLGRDEKVLLIAKESGDRRDFTRAMLQVVRNCMVSDVDPETLTFFDVEYLFLKLRMVSVDNICRVGWRDREDGQVYELSVDLASVEVEWPDPKPNDLIDLGSEVTVQLRWPTAGIYKEATGLSDDEVTDLTVARCVHKVFDGDSVTVADREPVTAIVAFLDSLPQKAYSEVKDFLASAPRLRHKIKYTDATGTEKEAVLSGIRSFFTL